MFGIKFSLSRSSKYSKSLPASLTAFSYSEYAGPIIIDFLALTDLINVEISSVDPLPTTIFWGLAPVYKPMLFLRAI